MQLSQAGRKVVNIFCSYSHKDRALKQRLEAHLAQLLRSGNVVYWSDEQLTGGDDWDGEIDEQLLAADIVLLLISADFLASRYCFEGELRCAVGRKITEGTRLIPIILRDCDWQGAGIEHEGAVVTLGSLHALLYQDQPIANAQETDAAFAHVARELRKAVEGLRAGRPGRGAAPAVADSGVDEEFNFPELIPYLCNRTQQEFELAQAVAKWRSRRLTKRPFVCFVHGRDAEALEWFRRRLHQVTLPYLLKSSAEAEDEVLYNHHLGALEDKDLPLPPRSSLATPGVMAEFLRGRLGMRVLDNILAPTEKVAQALSQQEGVPVMVHSILGTADLTQDAGGRSVKDFLDFWAGFPDVAPGRVLSFLFFKYEAGAPGVQEQFAKVNCEAERFFRDFASEAAGHTDVQAVVLTKLPSVPQRDAEDWVRNGDNFKNLCARHSNIFCDDSEAADDIRRLYESDMVDQESCIPMKTLAPELRRVVRNNRCSAFGL